MTEIVVFLLTFLVVLLIYELILVRKCKKDKKRKKPIEVQYLVNCYNLDLKKVNYKRLLNIISLVSSLDIAIVVTIIGLTNNFIRNNYRMFLTVILILASYYIVGKIYQKKDIVSKI